MAPSTRAIATSSDVAMASTSASPAAWAVG
ncbi:Uncharacterised protein [Bordetella pertussis]|nr:Uncharacterised protein [Bordetella pertussis]